MSEPTTPLMQQYHAIKARYPHALLLFRLGDFYELFYEDAMIASRELQITLTSRNREKGQPIPMCGVPYHAAEGYVARLIRAGFKIAICDQMEQPGPGKKLVRREVVRVITPVFAGVEKGNVRRGTRGDHPNNFAADERFPVNSGRWPLRRPRRSSTSAGRRRGHRPLFTGKRRARGSCWHDK